MKAINRLSYLVLIAVSILMYSCKKEVSLEKNMEEHFYLENRNANMPVWVKGNGLSNVFVLTVHGGPILGSGADFDNASFANEMEDKYAMVYWDQRHSSNSHGHLKKEDMTIEAMISDINALVQVLKKRYGDEISLFIMGHSWGGTLSTAYLSTRSKNVLNFFGN
jgi:pimeloyl-ACP methyl ester carboxylesterase